MLSIASEPRPEVNWTTEALQAVERFELVYEAVPKVRDRYRVLHRIGEGTFSSVYKAMTRSNEESESATKKKRQYRYVALKRVTSTSAPSRLYNEFRILQQLGGKHNVTGLIDILRHQDNVIAILPYHQHQEFRSYIDTMTLADYRPYLHCLCEALHWCHQNKIVHRDIKPANFLYHPRRKTGVLVDFGLAQTYDEIAEFPLQHKTRDRTLPSHIDPLQPLRVTNDPRSRVVAPRAGTRGFRAPEVLLRFAEQTSAIDMWAMGVILLSLLTRQFPFFASADDLDALAEIAHLTGMDVLNELAQKHGKHIWHSLTNVPSQAPWGDQDKYRRWRLLLHSMSRSFAEKDIHDHIEGLPTTLIDLLDGVLQVDATVRWSAADCMASSFLSPGSSEETGMPAEKAEETALEDLNTCNEDARVPPVEVTEDASKPTEEPIPATPSSQLAKVNQGLLVSPPPPPAKMVEHQSAPQEDLLLSELANDKAPAEVEVQKEDLVKEEVPPQTPKEASPPPVRMRPSSRRRSCFAKDVSVQRALAVSALGSQAPSPALPAKEMEPAPSHLGSGVFDGLRPGAPRTPNIHRTRLAVAQQTPPLPRVAPFAIELPAPPRAEHPPSSVSGLHSEAFSESEHIKSTRPRRSKKPLHLHVAPRREAEVIHVDDLLADGKKAFYMAEEDVVIGNEENEHGDANASPSRIDSKRLRLQHGP